MQQILLASSNPHKVTEIRAVLPASEVKVLCLSDLEKEIAEPVEDQPTFEGNAVLKARHYARASGLACLADDSGLEVDMLRGEPGVLSARYSGTTGTREEIDLANNRKLLDRLGAASTHQRIARFVCAMAFCEPSETDSDTPKALVRGTIEGRIITPNEAQDPQQPERGIGSNGFGYDPLFFVPDKNCTTAQLSPDEKNAISHRGNATRLMLEELKKLHLMAENV